VEAVVPGDAGDSPPRLACRGADRPSPADIGPHRLGHSPQFGRQRPNARRFGVVRAQRSTRLPPGQPPVINDRRPDLGSPLPGQRPKARHLGSRRHRRDSVGDDEQRVGPPAAARSTWSLPDAAGPGRGRRPQTPVRMTLVPLLLQRRAAMTGLHTRHRAQRAPPCRSASLATAPTSARDTGSSDGR
jgi:hypothetical protein